MSVKTLTPNLVLRQGYEMSVKELDNILPILADKKRKMEQEEAETNLQIMLDFLHCLRRQKLEELNEVVDLVFIGVLTLSYFGTQYSLEESYFAIQNVNICLSRLCHLYILFLFTYFVDIECI